MIKKFIIAACLLLSVVSFLLSKEHLPYSYYGIGDVRYKGTATFYGRYSSRGIGIHLNMDNPVSYANLKLTTFALRFLFDNSR
jgi:hypothetical protein